MHNKFLHDVSLMLKIAGPFDRILRGKNSRRWDTYTFTRKTLGSSSADSKTYALDQITNLLSYTKASTKGQGAGPENLPASVSMDINGVHLKGTRTPEERLSFFPDTWAGKTVLDIGCNHGGNLFYIADQIQSGTGIDFDMTCINAANKIKAVKNAHNLDFYSFDLEKEDLDLIKDFITQETVDVTLLLAVCAWIKNGEDVIKFTARISKALMFETNGNREEQKKQINALHKNYAHVQLLNETSAHKRDGSAYIARRLFYCHTPIVS